MSRASVVWRQLADAGVVSGDPPADAVYSPWYVRVVLGFGGWIAALFLLAFLATAIASFVREPAGASVLGVLMVGAASLAMRSEDRRPFLNQAALAVAFAGHALILYALVSTLDGQQQESLLAFSIAALETLLTVTVPHPAHRVVSAAAGGTALAFGMSMSGVHYLSAGLLSAIVAAGWLTELRWFRRGAIVRPILYGFSLALVGIQATWFGGLLELASGKVQVAPRAMGSAALAGLFMSVVAWLLRRSGSTLSGRGSIVALAAAAAVAVASMQAPGITVALMLVLIGYAHANRMLTLLGITAFLGYVSAYYYMLDTTLLVKATSLGATGAVLLISRAAFARWFGMEVDDEAGMA